MGDRASLNNLTKCYTQAFKIFLEQSLPDKCLCLQQLHCALRYRLCKHCLQYGFLTGSSGSQVDSALIFLLVLSLPLSAGMLKPISLIYFSFKKEKVQLVQKSFIRLSRALTYKHWISLVWYARCKHSSLLQMFTSYVRKKFSNIGLGANVIKLVINLRIL